MKVISQSFAVSEEEKLTVEVLARGEGTSASTFVRRIFYRGLSQYVGEPHFESDETEDVSEAEIFERVLKLIEGNDQLRRIKEAVATLREERSSQPPRVYSTKNMHDESKTAAKNSAKKTAGKGRRR